LTTRLSIGSRTVSAKRTPAGGGDEKRPARNGANVLPRHRGRIFTLAGGLSEACSTLYCVSLPPRLLTEAWLDAFALPVLPADARFKSAVVRRSV
jgi:hypothetical protein